MVHVAAGAFATHHAKARFDTGSYRVATEDTWAAPPRLVGFVQRIVTVEDVALVVTALGVSGRV
jgi:ABC-type amino acid transport substrate-binding protein